MAAEDSAAELEGRIGYRFQRRGLLLGALTHKSYANEHPEDAAGHSERLEFLGDAVLDLVVSEQIFLEYPALAEGEMTRVRAEVVSEKSLAKIGRRLGLGACLRLGRGEEQTGGRDKDSLLADALEAIFGAILQDVGFAESKRVILALLHRDLVHAAERKTGLDCKTRLQELFQAEHGRAPQYLLLDSSGPDHDKVYRVAVDFGGETIGRGEGKTKKQAEQEAACAALEALERL